MSAVVESIILDDWERSQRDQRIAVDPDAVEATIREIGPRWSADLFLLDGSDDVGNATRWLAVTASEGHYSVTAQLGEGGPWVTLVGDATAEGKVDFAHGGQGGAWPRRLIVSADDAVAAARHYVLTAELLDPPRWAG
jgi:hypothetical protein